MKRTATYSAKLNEIKRKWYLVDATGKTLGRLATKLARILMGKDKAMYTPHLDTGDFIVLINATKIAVTGKKETDKLYFSHSGYPGGDKLLNYAKVMSTKPSRIIRQAVWGMLPQNKLGKAMIKKLKIFSGAEHDHMSQKPEQINL